MDKKPPSIPANAKSPVPANDNTATAVPEASRAASKPHGNPKIERAANERERVSPGHAPQARPAEAYWTYGENIRETMDPGHGSPAGSGDKIAAEVALFSRYPELGNPGAREPVQAEAAPSAADSALDFGELPFSAASRLGGLRNLMISVGIQNLHKQVEQRKAGAGTGVLLSEHASYAVPDTAAGNETQGGTLAAITTRPEILPPRTPEVQERATPAPEKQSPRPMKPPKVNRWDSFDDVETLPARRGQYRKQN